MTRLTQDQIRWLLLPVQPHRVKEDRNVKAHLPQQDVRAHLTRIFGFTGYDVEMESELVFEEQRTNDRGEPIKGRWDVCYRAKARLTVKNADGEELAHYEDVATGDAQNQSRIDGHDLALKSAASTAIKRAATNLGDQFGLSLYNKGSREAFVRFVVGLETAPDVTEVAPADQVPGATEEDLGPAPDPHSSNLGVDHVGPAPEQVRVPQPVYDGSHGHPEDAPPPLPQTRQPMPPAPRMTGAAFKAWLEGETTTWSDLERQQITIEALGIKFNTGPRTATEEQWAALQDEWSVEGIPWPRTKRQEGSR